MSNPAFSDHKTHVRSKLKLRQVTAQSAFRQNFPEAHKFLEESGVDLEAIRQHSTKLLTAGAISGALLLPTGMQQSQTQGLENYQHLRAASSSFEIPAPSSATLQIEEATSGKKLPLPQPIAHMFISSGKIESQSPRQYLISRLNELLPVIVNKFSPPFLSREDEKIVEQIITRATNVPTKAGLEGEHLNTTYGYIGIEQHLARYPGDTIANHSLPEEGMAPGLGGFGHFNNGGTLTEDAVLREKYYVVAQLMYLPDWNQRTRYLANWYKWRKIIVVNPDNGNAVVGDIGDAGPAAWTGKHFGGSPEVMAALGGSRYTKGRVLFFFVDDPDNKIPLGPVNYDQISDQVVQQI